MNVSDESNGIFPFRAAENGDGGPSLKMAAPDLKNYPGAKGGAGVVHQIVNQMPPHEIYIEAFVGSGAVLRAKRPAKENFVIDADAEVIRHWEAVAGVVAICGDARSLLQGWKWRGGELVYCDPPYLRSVRSCQRDYYRHEMATDEEHVRLLDVLKSLPCHVILSGYPSALYSAALHRWRTVEFNAVDRRGNVKRECLWMNFQQPERLHDLRFYGKDKRERERIKRKRLRWVERLRRMPEIEREILVSAVRDLTSLKMTAAAGIKK